MTGDGTRTYLYDAANRLIEVRQGATVIAAFTYDADGRWTSMTTSSGTTRFFYDGSSTRVLYETDGSGNLLARYVYGPGDQLLAMVRGGVTYYYHYNGHGDVVALTDAAGTVVATYEYDAFGNHLATTGSVVNPYRYAGYRWDAETGLYYLNARYYLPSVGRFVTRDAFHGFEDDPASLNQYNYAHSNPVMFVDPSGYVNVPLILKEVARRFVEELVKRSVKQVFERPHLLDTALWYWNLAVQTHVWVVLATNGILGTPVGKGIATISAGITHLMISWIKNNLSYSIKHKTTNQASITRQVLQWLLPRLRLN